MAYHHLASNVDHYTLFIDNKETENTLDDTQLSSASDFSILLNPQLDLSSLLYLRAVEAKIAVGHLFLDNLPLTFTESEVIKVNVTIPLDSVDGNMTFNRTKKSKGSPQEVFQSLEQCPKVNFESFESKVL